MSEQADTRAELKQTNSNGSNPLTQEPSAQSEQTRASTTGADNASSSTDTSQDASGASSGSARAAMLRLLSDYRALQAEGNDGCSASPVSEDNLFAWKACIFGPPDTPWEGGVFQLRLQFTKDYPQSPPTVQFVTRMFHPNIYKDGTLCLDIIQSKWSPIYTVATILTSIQSLLQDPNPDSPANPEAAKLWSTDRKAYNRTVRMCVENSL